MVRTDTLRKHVLPNFPYLLIFWFCTKLGESYRLAGGDLLGMVRTINIALASIMPSFHPNDLLIGLAGTAIIYAVVYFRKKNAKKWRRDIEHGSARWGTPDDIRPFADKKSENNVILTNSEFLTMNPRPNPVKYARNKNMLVIGGSGSGKTRFVLKPNLMNCTSKDFPVSFVITDPKGDLVRQCGKMLERFGYRVKVMNTINFSKSLRYNPMAYIRSEKDILKLVTTLISNTKGEGKSSDPFWEKSETLLYTALIAYLHYFAPEEERNFAMLADMISSMEVREEDESFQNQVDMMFEGLKEKCPDHFAVRQYAKFKISAGGVL